MNLYIPFNMFRRTGANRVAIRQRRMSPGVIRSALNHRQCSILHCERTGKHYVIPSKPTPETEHIYATMALPLPTTRYQLTRGPGNRRMATTHYLL